MDLNDLEAFRRNDPGDMLGWIERLPQLCLDAWAAVQAHPLPPALGQAQRIAVTGMGGSAIAGDLLQALAAPEAPLPITVVRGYTLPAYLRGPETLVIASSYSGGTEETLAAYAEARARGAQLLAVTAGGRLGGLAREHGVPVVALPTAEPPPMPRAVAGYAFVALLGVLCQLGFVADKGADLHEAVAVMRARQPELRADTPVVRNPAKRMAGQLMGRIPMIYGAGLLAPVARRWKCQLNENAKNWSGYDELPELNHNSVAGILFPETLVSAIAVVMLTSSHDHPRVQRRFEVTRELLMRQGILVDAIPARGQSPLAHMLSTLHFGDYVSFYLAMAQQVDPTPIPPIDLLKAALAREQA